MKSIRGGVFVVGPGRAAAAAAVVDEKGVGRLKVGGWRLEVRW